MNSVLIIEDDLDISELLSLHLKDQNYTTMVVNDGEQGLKAALENSCSLIVLDVMLPNINGMEICKILRKKNVQTPILMLTSKSEEIDKVMGLEVGADDYLTKPFSMRELVARCKALMRRSAIGIENDTNIITRNSLSIDANKRKVEIDGKKIELTLKEFDLLYELASHPGKSYSREQLLKLVWGYEFNGYEHTVNSHINRLRSKIEPDINQPIYIKTVWGIGYSFNEE